MAFSITPLASADAAAAAGEFIQFRLNGEDLGDRRVAVLDIVGPNIVATRGHGQNRHVVTVSRYVPPPPPPPPPPAPELTLEDVPTTVDVDELTAGGQVHNTGPVAADWLLTPDSGLTLSQTSGTLAAGAAAAFDLTATEEGDFQIVLSSPTPSAVIIGSPAIVTARRVDPCWTRVSLLLKGEQGPAGQEIWDSSTYADHRAANPSLQRTTAKSRYGAGCLVTDRRGPLAAQYDGPRFAKGSTGLTVEGFANSVTQYEATATPLLLGIYSVSAGQPLFLVSKFSTGNRLSARFYDDTQVFDYEPDENGWVYWMMREPEGSSGDMEFWINEDLVYSTSQKIGEVGAPYVWVAGGDVLGDSAQVALCYHDNIRYTQCDRYPSGLPGIPDDFPTTGP